MKINEKTLFSFANSKPVDKEGYLSKRGEGKNFSWICVIVFLFR